MGNGIVKKGKIGQFLCRHKNTGWYHKESVFCSLNGDTHYKVCIDCGKKIDEQFISND